MKHTFCISVVVLLFFFSFTIGSTESPVILGTSAISNPIPPSSRDTSLWSEGDGNYVYFGSYPQTITGSYCPIKWKVLENGDTLFLWSDKVLDWHAFNSDSEKNIWDGSDVQLWLNDEFLATAFTSEEIAVIINSQKPEGKTITTMEAPALNGEKVFLLSWEELDTPSYGFFSDNSMLYSNKTKLVTASEYADSIQPFENESIEYQYYYSDVGVMAWTRSPSGIGVTDIGGGNYGGWFGREYPDKVYGIAPGINVNPSSVAFTTADIYEKPNTLTRLDNVEGIKNYKLTLFDSDGFTAKLMNSRIVSLMENIEISVSSIPEKQFDHLSAMLVRDDNVIAYGRVGDNVSTGCIEFCLPQNIEPGRYTLRLFAETSAREGHFGGYISNYADLEIIVYREKLILPDDLAAVENEAFQNTDIQYIVLPSAVHSIGSKAFTNCYHLSIVEFESSCVDIDDTAFQSVADLVFIAPLGGTVEDYAKKNAIEFVAK